MTLNPQLESQIRQLELKYVEEGYEVVRSPRNWLDLGDLQPDLVATKGKETVVVEFVVAQELNAGDAKLKELAHAVSKHPGWRLEVHSVGQGAVAPQHLLENSQELLRQVEKLLEQQMWLPAILTSWTIVELTLRALVLSQGEFTRTLPPNPRALVKDAFSLGLLSRGTMDELLALAQVRNGVAHGLSPEASQSLELTAKKLYGQAIALQGIAEEDETEASVEELVDWFHGNYDNPAEGVPYDSAEGGFQYVKGGPYDAMDELQDHFPNIRQDILEAAVRLITAEGWEWVKRGQY